MNYHHSPKPKYAQRHDRFPRSAVTTESTLTGGSISGSWPELWGQVQGSLRQQGYSIGTRKIYRHVLRSFSRSFHSTPDRVTAHAVRTHIFKLTDQHCSWSWTSTNISVLRAVFDHMGGMSTCNNLVTPKRPKTLPVILSRDEVLRLLSAADTARDQMLMGLLYGSGLKIGEACALKWSDVDCRQMELQIRNAQRTRRVPFASQLMPLLQKGCEICPPDDYIFRGNNVSTHLSTRMAEYVLRRAAAEAKIEKPVCAMVLRHSYAVHRLQAGDTIREVQAALGLRRIQSVMPYLRCMPPPGAISPLEALEAQTDLADTKPAALEMRTMNCDMTAGSISGSWPFEPVNISMEERVRRFYKSLKVHVRRRFLALRNAVG
jgi:site-specific recombinase XerD